MANVLTMSKKMYIASNYKELMNQSYKEFSRWKSTHNEVFLQQACEKIFNALEHYVELRKNVDIKSHSEFAIEFRLLNRTDASKIIPIANYLHRFFYEGKSLESDLSVIEEDYLMIYKYLKHRS